MMNRHFALSSELSGAIAKRLPHAKMSARQPRSASKRNALVTNYD